jgi:hypothetical protein
MLIGLPKTEDRPTASQYNVDGGKSFHCLYCLLRAPLVNVLIRITMKSNPIDPATDRSKVVVVGKRLMT